MSVTRLSIKSRARLDFLNGQFWHSEEHGRDVLCHDDRLTDMDTGEILRDLNTEEAVEDAWEEFRGWIASPI